MRASFVTRFGLGLLVGSVRASPCKPHSTTAISAAASSSWTVDVSGPTIVSSAGTQVSSTVFESEIIEVTTTNTAEDTATTTDVSSSSIIFSVETPISSTILDPDVTEGTTTAADTATAIDVEGTATTELTTTSETTSEAVTSTMSSDFISLAVTTTTSEATTSNMPTTTTSEAPWPLETFALISSSESGPLMGSAGLYRATYFGADDRSYAPLILTIEPETNRLRLNGGRYLCTSWGAFEWPGAILTCDDENSEVKYIECTQANNGELSCRGKAAQCGMGAGGLTCSSNGDYVSQFLVQQQEDGYRLFLAYGPSDEFSSVTLKAVQT